ncbi:MAG TPA: hypothetical protein VKT72_06150 [Candidatus Baltobacteraceae bacterium]|nr:hypothetical protein [Candidatus Baltobacteraceae bacterium]
MLTNPTLTFDSDRAPSDEAVKTRGALLHLAGGRDAIPNGFEPLYAVPKLNYDECVDALRALQRVPFARMGQAPFPPLIPLIVALFKRIEELDPVRASKDLKHAGRCRPRIEKRAR